MYSPYTWTHTLSFSRPITTRKILRFKVQHTNISIILESLQNVTGQRTTCASLCHLNVSIHGPRCQVFSKRVKVDTVDVSLVTHQCPKYWKQNIAHLQTHISPTHTCAILTWSTVHSRLQDDKNVISVTFSSARMWVQMSWFYLYIL